MSLDELSPAATEFGRVVAAGRRACNWSLAHGVSLYRVDWLDKQVPLFEPFSSSTKLECPRISLNKQHRL